MAKAFDLVHKVTNTSETATENPIPFEDSETPAVEENQPKKRLKIEVIFFYLLLFAVFFVMGAMFLAPEIFSYNQAQTTASPNPNASDGPNAGFAITKPGEDPDPAITPTSSPTTIENKSPVPEPSASQATSPVANTVKTGTKIQILNGTNTEGKAASFRTKLANKGIIVDSIGNYKKRTVQRTTIYYLADYKQAAKEVQSIVGGLLVQTTANTTGNNQILVVVGKSS